MKKTISYFLYAIIILISSQISGMLGIKLTLSLILTNIVIFYFVLILFLLIKYKIRNIDRICKYNPELSCPKEVWYASIFENDTILSENKIMDDNMLAKMEMENSSSLIWLMSLNYSYEANFENEFADVVRKNLERNIHYCMFALHNEISEQRAKDISLYYRQLSKNITFVLMNDSPLELMLPLYDFIIINPNDVDRKGYICIGENDSGSNTLFKELDKNLTEQICAQCNSELKANRNKIFNGNECIKRNQKHCKK